MKVFTLKLVAKC